jgi:hypothetical protein
MLADGLVKKVLLRKAGWLIRLVIPLLIKNYASHVGEGGPEKWVSKIKKFFSKNGKAAHTDQETGMDAV